MAIIRTRLKAFLILSVFSLTVLPAFAGEDVILENMTYPIKEISETWRADKITFKNSSLDKVTLTKIFDKNQRENAGEQLATLNADSIAFTNLQKIEEEDNYLGKKIKTTTYETLVMDKVVRGRIETTRAPTILMEQYVRSGGDNAPKPLLSAKSDQILFRGLHLANIFKVLFNTDQKQDANNNFVLLDNYILDNLVLKTNSGILSFSIGQISSDALILRPSKKQSYMSLLGEMTNEEDRGERKETDIIKNVAETLVRFHDTFSYENLKITKVSVVETKEEKPVPVFSIEELTFAPDGLSLKGILFQNTVDLSYSPEPSFNKVTGIVKESDLGKLKETTPEFLATDTYKFDQFTISKVSFSPTRDVLARVSEMASSDIEAFMENLDEIRNASPKFGTWAIDGFSFARVINGKAGGKVAITSVRVEVIEQIHGLFTNIKLSLDHATASKEMLSFSIVPTVIQDLNLPDLDLKGQTHFFWDKETKEIRLRDTTFTSSQLGSLSLNATLGNVTEKFFSVGSSFQSSMIFLKSVTLSVQDFGLLDFYLKAEAQRTKQPVPLLREDLVKQVSHISSGVPKTLSAALLNMLKGLQKLNITISSKKPEGVGFMESIPLALDYKSNSAQFWDLWNVEIK